ncbi:hypothetical protein FA13DRAFT_1807224 [Coprinellus micaceus]|uniref:Telomere length regulation protein conserved domain-containing protein n=1 Tax=Coprinellus micaceus TaxID=71717 RepID=A0A4Y7RBS9_COPMI|nr:hypothetical protein FA13DRAFT_1807224 [Coprinellus micaceus]
MAVRSEALISTLAPGKKFKDSQPHISYLLGRLVSQGLFHPVPPTTRTQPSFFQSTLPIIQSKLYASDRSAYFAYWHELLQNLLSTLALQSILISLFGSLRKLESPPLRLTGETCSCSRGSNPSDFNLLEHPFMTTSCGRQWRSWPLSHTRIFVCWVSGGARGGDINTAALDSLLQNALELWANAEHVKHSLLSQHQYLTSLLLLAASYFKIDSQPMRDLSFNPAFIQGVSRYLGRQDASVRRCGLLVGREIARMSGKSLEFGVWDGDDSGKVWARTLRRLIQGRDVDVVLGTVDAETAPKATPGVVDDAEVEEFVSPAERKAAMVEEVEERQPEKVQFKSTAQGSASPSPSEIEEIEKDPTLNVAVKVQRPVCLRQLGDLLRGTGQKAKSYEPHEADKIEMALNYAEELIRKKRDYEQNWVSIASVNAVNLEYSLLSLNDNYDLDDFAAKRQGALNVLVACAPRQAAPALIEEFFKNQYSVDQRYVLLNALALGARELASLPVPESRVPQNRIAFPRKTLPGGGGGAPPSTRQIHRRWKSRCAARSLAHGSWRTLVGKHLSIRNVQRTVPALVREKILRIKKSAGISAVAHQDPLAVPAPPKRTTYTEVAAEYFIMPLINRFWLFLREEQMREERRAHMHGRSKYHGAGHRADSEPNGALAVFANT